MPPAAKAVWWPLPLVAKIPAWAPKPPPPAPPPSTAAVAAAAAASGRRGLDLLQPLLPRRRGCSLASRAPTPARATSAAPRARFALACAADALDACIHLLLALALSGAVHVDHHDLHHAEHLALASAAVACAAAIGGELLGKEGDHGHGHGHSKAH